MPLMQLPVMPPVKPMLAKSVPTIPTGEMSYEPKWDGFRCLAFKSGSTVDLRGKSGKPLGRFFPEVVSLLEAVPVKQFVVDGELVIEIDGLFVFDALQMRLHPAASRVNKLALETPASFVGFDLLAAGGRDLRDSAQHERRARLEQLLRDSQPPIYLTPMTRNRAVAAEWLERF